MKKIPALILATLMLLSFAACKTDDNGDSSTTKSTEGTVNAEDVISEAFEDAEEHDSFSQGAVEYYLDKTVGIKLSSLEPDWEWKLKSDYSAYADDPSSGYGHAVITFTKAVGEITDDEYDAWYAKVFDATAKASDDGYNIKGYEFSSGGDALEKVTLDDALNGFLKGWGFRKDGKNYVVYVSSEYDSKKDSEIGKLLYYDGAKVDIAVGLQKSMEDSMNEAESYIAENEDEFNKALEDYFN